MEEAKEQLPNPLEEADLPPAPSETTTTPGSSDSSEGPEFTPLEAEPPTPDPEFEPLPGPETASEVEPFTGEEIASGLAWAVMAGLRLSDEKQIEAFQRAFVAAVPIMPTPAVLDALGVGDALAAYGIHKGMVGGPDTLATLPPWLRLLIGAGYLAFAVYTGVRAAKEVKGEKEAPRVPAAGPGAAGPGLGEEVLRGPFEAASAL